MSKRGVGVLTLIRVSVTLYGKRIFANIVKRQVKPKSHQRTVGSQSHRPSVLIRKRRRDTETDTQINAT